LIGALVAIAATLALAPGAGATVHSSGGIKYVTKAIEVKGNAQATGVASCPKHTHVLGGGERNTGGYGSIRLNQTFPRDSHDPGTKPDDGWKVRVHNAKAKKLTVRVRAICGKTKVRYTLHRFVAPASTESNEVNSQCPSGTHAYSGGVGAASKSPIFLNSTFPEGPTGATSWGAYVDNPSSAADPNVTVYAVCGNSTPKIVSAMVSNIPAHSEAKLVASCPAHMHAYGGGVGTSAGYLNAAINTLSPSPSTGPPGRGWKAGLDITGNLSSLFATTYVVCGKKLN
jgi:hypothetical protein